VSALLPDFSLRIPRTICILFQFMIPASLGATLHIAFLFARALNMYCVGCISYSSLPRSHLSGNHPASSWKLSFPTWICIPIQLIASFYAGIPHFANPALRFLIAFLSLRILVLHFEINLTSTIVKKLKSSSLCKFLTQGLRCTTLNAYMSMIAQKLHNECACLRHFSILATVFSSLIV